MEKLKVLHLGYSDDYGGASVAMLRIHEAVSLNENVISKVAVIEKKTNRTDIYSLSKTSFEKVWTYVRVRVAYKLVNILQKTSNSSGRSINIFPSSVLKRIDEFNADIIHLHWIGNETIKIEQIAKIKQPIIWTFHDKWAMLGAEYTDLSDSVRYIEGYDRSNFASDSSGLDIDKHTWQRKLKVFNKKNIQPVAVSSWLKQEIEKSFIWKQSKPIIINNPINNNWKIESKAQARVKLDLPENGFIICFGAINALADELKGYKLLRKAIEVVAELKRDEKIVCVIFGDDNKQTINVADNLEIRVIGRIKDREILNSLYSAANVTAVSSYFETFGQVALESICCGTPVACFETSGLKDVVVNNVNGVFAQPGNYSDLAQAIIKAASIQLTTEYITNYSSKFSSEFIGEKYNKLYHQVLNS